MRILVQGTISTGLLCLSLGCEGGSFGFHYYDDDPPPPRAVIVEHGHVCTHACAHYYDGTRYIVVRQGHRHGPNCGHHFDGSHWVIVARSQPVHVHEPAPRVVEVQKAPAQRVHPPPTRVVEVGPPPGPSHLYVLDRRGNKWVMITKGHVHSHNCGHVYVEGRWCIH